VVEGSGCRSRSDVPSVSLRGYRRGAVGREKKSRHDMPLAFETVFDWHPRSAGTARARRAASQGRARRGGPPDRRRLMNTYGQFRHCGLFVPKPTHEAITSLTLPDLLRAVPWCRRPPTFVGVRGSCYSVVIYPARGAEVADRWALISPATDRPDDG
jgi:hypothetical protein